MRDSTLYMVVMYINEAMGILIALLSIYQWLHGREILAIYLIILAFIIFMISALYHLIYYLEVGFRQLAEKFLNDEEA